MSSASEQNYASEASRRERVVERRKSRDGQNATRGLALNPSHVLQFVHAAPFAFALFNRNMTYLAHSDKWLEDYGLVGQTIIGKSQYDVFPKMTDEWRARYSDCLAGQMFEDQESQFERADGTIEWIKWKMNPWVEADGAIGGLILFTENITVQKEKELELDKNQKFLSAVLDSVQDGIVACDADGQLTLFNTATRELHGLPEDAIPADQWADHYDLYLADGETPMQMEDIPLFKALNGDKVRADEMVIAPSGKEPRRVLARGQVMLDSEGNKLGAVASMHDITEQAKISAELTERENRYRVLYNDTPAMLHSVDTNGELIRVSDYWIKTLGYAREDVIGKRFVTFLTDDSRLHVERKVLPEFVSTGQINNAELKVKKGDGSIIDIQLSAVAQRNEKGEVDSSLTVLSNITDRKEMERAVRRSEEEYRSLYNETPAMLHSADKEGKLTSVSDFWLKTLGYTRDDIIGTRFYDLLPNDSRDYFLGQLLPEFSETGHLENVECKINKKDGQSIDVQFSLIAQYDDAGKVESCLTILTDVSDRKLMERALRRSEEQFRSAFQTSPQGMALISPAGNWLTANKALCEIFGYTEKELLNIGIRQLTHPDDLDTEVEDIKGMLAGAEESHQFEKRYLHKDGSTIWALASISLVRDETNAPLRFVLQMLDLTKRKEAEQQLLQAQKLEAVGQLTGGLAHDFNNLLAVSLISLQLLERTHLDDEKSLKRIRAALDATERGADLTRRLLAFSRKQNLEQKVVDVNSLLQNTKALLKRTLGGAVQLETHTQEGLWKVEVDDNQLESALLNLAINARDAMPDGGDLTIETHNVDLNDDYEGAHTEVKAGRYVLIAVTDTGTGIPEDVIEKVFQPFFTTKEVGKGTGLGLSMVYGFAKQSGGHVEIYSEMGIGTSFKIYLRATDIDAELEIAKHEPTNYEDVIGGTEVILVTEDDPDVRESVMSLFDSLGYRTLEAQDAHAAVEILETDEKIDLLFSDIVMPGGMNGIALANKARELRPGLKVMLTTGFAEVAITKSKMPTEKTEIIGKPYRREDLAKKVRGVLDA